MSAEPAGRPWDRLEAEGETLPDYARFLTYRNLGPRRSLDAAYRAHKGVPQGVERLQAPGQWARLSARFRWPQRAESWDVHTLGEVGQRVVARYVAALEALAGRLLTALLDTYPAPRAWRDLVDTIRALGEVIPPELIQAALKPAPAPAEQPNGRVCPPA